MRRSVPVPVNVAGFRFVVCAFALLVGCQPTSEILVHVDTDAPVPPRAGSDFDPNYPPWLFDRLRVDILRDGAPVARREFAVDQGLFLDGKVSFGVAPPVGDRSFTARLRLYRGDHTLDPDPQPTASLDTTIALPPVDDSSRADVSVFLRTEDVGTAIGPIAPTPGLPGASQASTWPGATIVPCNGDPRDDEVCVPGGAFWMGDPYLRGIVNGEDADRERLVVLSPFFIQTQPMTVAKFRAFFGQTVDGYDNQEWNELEDPTQFASWCTFTPGPSAADPSDAHGALALNCVTYVNASHYCRIQYGGNFPSEAQLEFVASGRGLENAYPWGGDDPACGDSIWGWGGIGETYGTVPDCRDNARTDVVTIPGTGTRDRIAYPDGGGRTIVDLAGNLAQFTADLWSRQDEAYWSKPGVFTDPVADLVSPADGPLRVARGGAFYDVPLESRAGFRRPIEQYDSQMRSEYYYGAGFRCARPAL